MKEFILSNVVGGPACITRCICFIVLIKSAPMPRETETNINLMQQVSGGVCNFVKIINGQTILRNIVTMTDPWFLVPLNEQFCHV